MKLKVCISLLLPLLVLTGCDFFRALAGRPTSAELAALRPSVTDTLPALADTLPAMPDTLVAPVDSAAVRDSVLSALALQIEPEHGFLTAVGSFHSVRNAEKYARMYREKGYEVCIVEWHGVHVVGLNPTDDHAEALRLVRKVRYTGECPGSWVLKNN